MKPNLYIFIGIISLLTIYSCHNHEHGHQKGEAHKHHHGHSNEHMNSTSFEELAKRFESKERDEYQQPEKVIAFLGDVSGQTIMDIGAGTGYFSFKLAEAGAKVIAADVDDRFQNYIKEKKEELSVTDEKIELRKIPYDTPNLANEEVNMVLIVNTYHHIEDRISYFEKVKKGLKPNGKLVVIDFFKKELPIGPPSKMKIERSKVSKELKEAGFSNIEINDELLEYQFVLIAQ
jgi:ubiquinone/menaquinone biosynthesis C-methylase UbiE